MKHEECERLRSEMRKGKDTVAIAEEAERRNDALEQEIDVHRQAMEEKEEEVGSRLQALRLLSLTFFLSLVLRCAMQRGGSKGSVESSQEKERRGQSWKGSWRKCANVMQR